MPWDKITQKPASVFTDDDETVLVKHKQAFRLSRNPFNKLLRNSKNIYLTEFSTD